MSSLHALFDLTGRTALVTGASRGLGAAAADGLARAGCDLVITGRHRQTLESRADELREHGTRVEIAVCDMARPKQITRALGRAQRLLGRLDILVNNAGTIARWPAADYPLEEWRRVVDTNMTGLFLMAQGAGRIMIEQGGGNIINIASLLSFSGGRFVSAYTASKHGVAGITKALASEWAAQGINVNAIAPGYFVTDATEALRSDRKRKKELTARIPVGRWGEPEDLVGSILFLASDAARYVHGHVLVVDGGWEAA